MPELFRGITSQESENDKFSREKLIELIDKPFSIEINNFLNEGNLEKFNGIDKEILFKLIKAGYGHLIPKVFNKCLNLDYGEIVDELFRNEQGEVVAYDLDLFIGLNHQTIVDRLFAAHCGEAIARSIDRFQGLNHQTIIDRLFEAKCESDIAVNIGKFQGINHQEIINRLFEIKGGVLDIVDNIYNFKDIDHAGVIDKLFDLKDNEAYIFRYFQKLKINSKELLNKIGLLYPDFIEEMKLKFPQIYIQMEKSSELILGMFMIKNNLLGLKMRMDLNPFLSTALEENPRYGSKLILKYREFDKTSKENIKKVFSIKEEILEENPEIIVNSLEFRKLAQEKLASYKNNPKILKDLENRGVNVDNWLNYDNPIYFTLGEQEDVKFSDKIKMPVTRIRETLIKYQDSIIKSLSEYKSELQNAFISNQESEELKQKIKELELKITDEKDEKKVLGMQKGLSGLKAKEASLKPINIWSKVQGDIFRLKSMIDNIFKFHDSCVVSEQNLETIKDRKELIKEKDKLEKNKSQLKENFKEFEAFFESYETKLQELIIPSLGQDRADSLLQDIKERVGEEFSHYDTDKNTLNDIFKGENKDGDDLNGRDMEISISSRSVEDLYLGNYCPCCICIDSEHHGAESPIADYVTDLGMQNIVIYDKKKNVPILTCWTFIGENSFDGEPILVIDNIEANTEYTNGYPDKLKEIITQFVYNYAEVIGITKIIQGPDNNDLVVFPLGKVKRKLGSNYNRSDGYFLEAEK